MYYIYYLLINIIKKIPFLIMFICDICECKTNLIRCSYNYIYCIDCFIELIKNTYTNEKLNCACNKHKLNINNLEFININSKDKKNFINNLKHFEKLRYIFKNKSNIEYIRFILLDKQTKLSNLIYDFKIIYDKWYLPKIINNNYNDILKDCITTDYYRFINQLINKYNFNKENLTYFINIMFDRPDEMMNDLLDEFIKKYDCKVFEYRETIINCPYFIEENEHKIFCKGKIDTKTWKCLECNKSVCPKCYSIYESNHKCNIETFDMTKCPKCHVSIERSGGCNDMKCTNCNTSFNIKTNEITEINTNETYKSHYIYGDKNVINNRIIYNPRTDYMGIDFLCGQILNSHTCYTLIYKYDNPNLEELSILFDKLNNCMFEDINKNSIRKIIKSIIKNTIFNNNDDMLNDELIDIYNEYKTQKRFNKSIDIFKRCLSSILIDYIIDITQINNIFKLINKEISNIKRFMENKLIGEFNIDYNKTIDLYKEKYKYSLLSIPLNKSKYNKEKNDFYKNHEKSEEFYIDIERFNKELNEINLLINKDEDFDKDKFIIDYDNYKKNIIFINKYTSKLTNLILNLLSFPYKITINDIINNMLIERIDFIKELFDSNVFGYKLDDKFNIIKI